MKRDGPACPCDRCAKFIEGVVSSRDAALASLKEHVVKELEFKLSSAEIAAAKDATIDRLTGIIKKETTYKSNLKNVLHLTDTIDPYPELTAQQSIQRGNSGWSMFDLFIPLPKIEVKHEISAHRAWRDGFEFAKQLLLKELEK